MSSAAHGPGTSKAEVTRVSANGFELLLGAEVLFVSFDELPWFANASIEQVTNVRWLSRNHLYWPELDVDVTVDSIRHPGAYPLVSRVTV